MRTLFKDTKIGGIPEDWELLPFDDCIDKEGHTGEYRKLQTKDYLDEGWYPIIDQGQEFIAGYTNDENDVYTGSLPVTIFGDHTLFVKFVNMKFAIGADGTVLLYPNKNKLTHKFFYYLISNHKIKSEGYQRHVKYLKQKWFAIPPLPEQRKIAEILSTVDETIEKTDAIIRETQQLKKGLMQKLFTAGIRHTRFKETEIGRIPEEWEVTRIGGVTEIHGGSTPLTTRQGYWENGDILWATPTDITSLGNKYISDTSRKISQKAVDETSLRLCEPGTILVTSRATIGYPAIAEKPITTNQGFINVHCRKTIDTIFLYYWIIQNRRILESFAQGSTFAELSKKDFRRLFIALPPLTEQHTITAILSEVDVKIEAEQAFKAELARLKKGLMQVLLTGKIRVKV